LSRLGEIVLLGATGLAAMSVGLGAGTTQPAELRWKIQDLGAFGGQSATAVGITKRGQVVVVVSKSGEANANDRHVLLWQKGKVTVLAKRVAGLAASNGRGDVVVYRSDMRNVPWRNRFFVVRNGKTTALESLGGRRDHSVSAINDRGQVVGASQTRTGERHAFLWENGTTRDLGPAGVESEAAAINDRGLVAGWAADASGDSYPVIWDGGDTRKLCELGAADELSKAAAVNEQGQVVGGCMTRLGKEVHAFLWQRGRLVDLGTLGGPQSGSYAVALNALGQVVGKSYVYANTYRERAFFWRNGKLTDVGTLGGREEMTPVAINRRGQVVGSGQTTAGRLHAFAWQDSKLTDLGTLPGGKESWAEALNNHGQIVGWSTTKSGQRHAVIWERR
jgi:probable HAF family extracellular repeat protein